MTDTTDIYIPCRQMTKSERRQRVKKDVYERDGGLCRYCGRDLDLDFNNYRRKTMLPRIATVDHLLEKRKGGLYSRDNLWCCCQKCNNKRDHLGMKPDEFVDWRKKNPIGPWPNHLSKERNKENG